jgi:hypothetical protein
MLTIYRRLGTDMVTIRVGTGEQQQKFVLHKKLLSSKALVFGKMFNSGFQEGLSQSTTLPEDNPKIFALFVDWVYLNTLLVLPLTDKDKETASEAPRSFPDLFSFGDKYCVGQLCDAIMDATLLVGKRFDGLAGYTMMEDSYRNTRPGSKPRLYVLRSYIYKTKGARGPSAWDHEKFHELALKCNDLLFDFFAETVSNRNSNTWATARNPNAFPRCDYYQHGKD